MRRLLIEPSTFEILPIQDKQNPYIEIKHHVNRARVAQQHEELVQTLAKGSNGVIVYRLPSPLSVKLPDIVFTANGALSLPRLVEPLILLPNMKYPQRKAELPFLATMFAALGLRTMDYPGREPFEGQAELKWFDGGRKAVCGYGHRSTKRTFEELDELFGTLYGPDKKPTLLVLPLASADYYHLDVAMCEYAPSGSATITKCLVHKRAFSDASHATLRDFLGSENVTVIDTADSFCLNAVIDGPTMITHKLTDPALKPLFEKATGRRVVQVPTTEFEKSGGSVRCMTLDIF
jgi:N-dimethylarginine dimethylaminohydrolase